MTHTTGMNPQHCPLSFQDSLVWYTERDYNIQVNYKKLQTTKSPSPFKLLSTS